MVVVVPLIVIALFSACSYGPAERRTAPLASAAGEAEPWAEEFADAIAKSQSAYERGVLSDGAVDPAEVADAHARMQRCLGDSGYRIGYEPDGGFEIAKLRGGHASDDMTATNEVLEACEAKYDQFVTFLYEQTRRNPQQLDEATIAVACLRKSGLVGKDYTERRWRADDDTGDWPYDDYDPRAVQCRLDPLGLWRDQ